MGVLPVLGHQVVSPRFQGQVHRQTISGGGQVETYDDVVIVGGARTPFGKLGGGLSGVSNRSLMRVAMLGALQDAQVRPESIDQVISANVIKDSEQAGFLHRNSALDIGVPMGKTAFEVNRLCGTGFELAKQAAEQVSGYDAEDPIVLVGAVENMSRSPVIDNQRLLRMKNAATAIKNGGLPAKIQGYATAMVADRIAPPFDNPLLKGLTDPMAGLMLDTADRLAKLYGISREEADAYALQSQQRAMAAWKSGKMADEVVPVTAQNMFPDRDVLHGEGVFQDEHMRSTTAEKLAKLRVEGQNKADAIHTAGNSSGTVDGAAALVITSEKTAAKRNLKTLLKLKAIAVTGCDPDIMGIAPARAMPAALKAAGLQWSDVDMFEINEAFAGQVLAVQKEIAKTQGFKIPNEKLNQDGGGISLGHPIAVSGLRLLLHATKAMNRENWHYGLLSACIGGGQGIAAVVENPNYQPKPALMTLA